MVVVSVNLLLGALVGAYVLLFCSQKFSSSHISFRWTCAPVQHVISHHHHLCRLRSLQACVKFFLFFSKPSTQHLTTSKIISRPLPKYPCFGGKWRISGRRSRHTKVLKMRREESSVWMLIESRNIWWHSNFIPFTHTLGWLRRRTNEGWLLDFFQFLFLLFVSLLFERMYKKNANEQAKMLSS